MSVTTLSLTENDLEFVKRNQLLDLLCQKALSYRRQIMKATNRLVGAKVVKNTTQKSIVATDIQVLSENRYRIISMRC